MGIIISRETFSLKKNIIIIITIIITGIYKIVTIIDITVASAKRTLLNAVVRLLVPTSKQQKSR